MKINAFELLQCLPVEEHEPVLTLLFSVMGGEHLQRYIALLPLDASLFSLRLSQQMVTELHRWVKHDSARFDYALRHVMSDFACLLAPKSSMMSLTSGRMTHNKRLIARQPLLP